MKYYVVADVHGFFTPLQRALSDKGFFDDPEPHKLIVCGDLMDRGNEARKMQRFVLDLMERDEIILIRGNHEDLILDMIEELKTNPFSVSRHHVSNGTLNTAFQLCGAKAFADDLKFPQSILRTAYCKKIIPATRDFYETSNYVFVHGWIPCNRYRSKKPCLDFRPTGLSYNPDWRNASKEEWRAARWFNGMEAGHKFHVKEPNKTIVCGHWHCSFGWSHYKNDRKEFPTKADTGWKQSFIPYVEKGLIALDGCTAFSGIVNCIVIED